VFERYVVDGDSSSEQLDQLVLAGIVSSSLVLYPDKAPARPPIIVCNMSLKTCLNATLESAEPLHQQATDTLPSAARVSRMRN
jgi:hypothetical protein